jgi:uncharacterized membrane protein YqaE (UPF0057 family)
LLKLARIECCDSLNLDINEIATSLVSTKLFLHLRKITMRLLLAIFLPFISFFTIGRPLAGIVCLFLQITVIGWIPAAIWAVFALGQYKTDKKIEKVLIHSQSSGSVN